MWNLFKVETERWNWKKLKSYIIFYIVNWSCLFPMEITAPKFFTVQKKNRKQLVATDPFSKQRDIHVPTGPGFQLKKNERKETKFVEFQRKDHGWTVGLSLLNFLFIMTLSPFSYSFSSSSPSSSFWSALLLLLSPSTL